jgi:hypothetical protein
MSGRRLRATAAGAAGPRANKSARLYQPNTANTALEDAMTNAAQALLMTAGLFGLSFFTIFAFWYAERMRVGAPAKLPV